MRVDFTEWYAGQRGLVARKYTYSQMKGARDIEVEVHFDLQAGLSIHTFVTFLISDIDVSTETRVQVSLRAMDNDGPNATLTMLATPDGRTSNIVIGLADRDATNQCLAAFLAGKDMHFAIDTVGGEPLVRLPLPNDATFKVAFDGSYRDLNQEDVGGLLNLEEQEDEDQDLDVDVEPELGLASSEDEWQSDDKYIVRHYIVPDFPLPTVATWLKIECSVTRYLNGVVDNILRFYLRPYAYLFAEAKLLDPEEGIVSAPFSVGLFAAGSGAGTEDDPLFRGGMFEASVSTRWDQLDTMCLEINSNAAFAVKAIATGEELTFSIYDSNAKPPVRLKLRLPNDQEFGRLYIQHRANV